MVAIVTAATDIWVMVGRESDELGSDELESESKRDKATAAYAVLLWGFLEKRQTLETKLANACKKAVKLAEEIEALDREHINELAAFQPDMPAPERMAEAEKVLAEKGVQWSDFAPLKASLGSWLTPTAITKKKAFVEILRRSTDIDFLADLLNISTESVRREIRRIEKSRKEDSEVD